MSNSELPRVTDIIKPFSNFKHVQEKVLFRAAERGTAVHSVCQKIAMGEWVIDEFIPEELKGYIASFRQWHEKIPKKYLVIEKRYRSEKMGYTGQVDFVIESADGNPYLIDIKTSASHHKTYPLQMAAYTKLLHEANIMTEGADLLYLSKDGKFPKVVVCKQLSEDIEVFEAALKCYNYFNPRKEK